MIEKDVWLHFGYKCEVWGHLQEKQLKYFYGYDENNNPLFCTHHGLNPLPAENYYVISTPWDYAPKEALKIRIYKNGLFKWINENNGISDMTFNWKDCPDHLKGKTLLRPEWAKE